MQLRRATYEDAGPLVDALDAELMERYGGGDDVRITPSDFLAPQGIFLIGALGGRDVA